MTGRLHTCYSPVRRSPAVKASFNPDAPRLACVRPVASVHPEPGSNSPLFILTSNFFFFIGSLRLVCLKLKHIGYFLHPEQESDAECRSPFSLVSLVLTVVFLYLSQLFQCTLFFISPRRSSLDCDYS